MEQANNIQWLDLSNLQMDPSWTYTLAGLGVKLAYRVSTSCTISNVRSFRADGTPYVPLQFIPVTTSYAPKDLHSARFRLEKSIAQKRNTVFWQMFLMDTMLVSVRPC